MTKKNKQSKLESFITKVKSHRKKPLQPTNKSFSIGEWQDIYWSIERPTIEESRLFLSGIWFYKYFRDIVQEFDDIIFSYRDTKENLIRLQVGAANYLSEKESKIHNEEIIKKDRNLKSCILTSSLSSDLIVNIENIVDSITYSLIKINKINSCEINSNNNSTLEKWIETTLNLSITYNEFKHFWMQCLWQNWYIEKPYNKIEVICPENQDRFIKHCVSSFWNEDTLYSQFMLGIQDWKEISTVEKYNLLTQPIIKIEAITKEGHLKLKVSDRSETLGISPSEIAILSITINNTRYQEWLKESCPNFHDLTLWDLLACWRFISPIASQLQAREFDLKNLSMKEILFEYSPTFSKKHLISLITEAFDFTREQATIAIDLLTFKGEYEEDIWCQPLIKVDDEYLTIVYKSLSYPNLSRYLDKWIEKSGWNKGELRNKPGKFFEKFVREKLIKCNKIKKLKIYNCSIDFSKYLKNTKQKQTESDLIISIGNKIILGEIKSSKYPTEPIDYNYYYQDLLKAAEQLIERKSFVEKNLSIITEALQIFHFQIEQLQIIPVIISNYSLATGQKFLDIPVVDIHILERYLSQNTITFSKYSSNEREIVKQIELYSSEQEAENNIEEYLNNPPQVKIILDRTKPNYTPIYNTLSPKKPRNSIYCYKTKRENIALS